MLARRRAELPTALPGDPAALLVVTFAHPSGPLHVATTVPAWEQDAGGVRLAQATAVAQALGSPELDGVPPVVLGADLNAGPGTPEFEVLAEGLVDAWAAVRAGDRAPRSRTPTGGCRRGSGSPTGGSTTSSSGPARATAR